METDYKEVGMILGKIRWRGVSGFSYLGKGGDVDTGSQMSQHCDNRRTDEKARCRKKSIHLAQENKSAHLLGERVLLSRDK